MVAWLNSVEEVAKFFGFPSAAEMQRAVWTHTDTCRHRSYLEALACIRRG